MIMKPLPTYSSFLLRLWHEGDSAETRITLQNVAGGKQIHFTDLQRLVTFLHDQSETKGDNDQ